MNSKLHFSEELTSRVILTYYLLIATFTAYRNWHFFDLMREKFSQKMTSNDFDYEDGTLLDHFYFPSLKIFS